MEAGTICIIIELFKAMPKPPKNSLGFMTVNSGPDLISEEMSREIARFEGISLSKVSPLSASKRRNIDERIISTVPPEFSEELRKSLEERDRILSQPTDVSNSRSYIRIVCTEDAEPKYNRLQLRTEPSTYIELQPGENILTVEKYPALKYGFCQIDDPYLESENSPYECNGGGIKHVDLSHYNPSEMVSMNNMFRRMDSLLDIDFGRIRIENVESMDSAFEWTDVGHLDLTGISFSKVVSAEMMIYAQGNISVNLTGADLSNITKAEGIFNGVDELILDNAILSDAVIYSMAYEEEYGCECLKKISLRGCAINMIEDVLTAVIVGRPENWQPIEVILDDNICYREIDGRIQCSKDIKKENRGKAV